MTARMNVSALAPEAYRAMINLDRHAGGGDLLPSVLVDLVKLRVSQINGCAYCVDLHSTDLKKAGEPDERVYAVAVWQEAPFFTDPERAALALAESMTRLPDPADRVPDEVWQQAANHFDESALAALVMAIATINAWNRIGVSTRMVPESYAG